jgi:hypothetical protein
MVLHKFIQKLILTGADLPSPGTPKKLSPPPVLLPLINAIAPIQRAYNARAIEYGHRYRSAFWLIYLLSAIAVLCAGLPLALGWDNENHDMNHYSVVWVMAEALIILLVGLIYWRGHRQDWQGQWLGARTKAELAWYLALIAPLIDFEAVDAPCNWYTRLFNPAQEAQGGVDIDTLCAANAALARSALSGAWSDPQFVTSYARWTVDILDGQRHYHHNLARHQHLSHLLIHSKVLTLMTTFFPALGASLHGALAQSEAYRLEATSRRLEAELERVTVPILATLAAHDPLTTTEQLRAAVLSAVALIIDEHQDWHMLVRPHHLPLG